LVLLHRCTCMERGALGVVPMLVGEKKH